jgi:hypothetical protein
LLATGEECRYGSEDKMCCLSVLRISNQKKVRWMSRLREQRCTEEVCMQAGLWRCTRLNVTHEGEKIATLQDLSDAFRELWDINGIQSIGGIRGQRLLLQVQKVSWNMFRWIGESGRERLAFPGEVVVGRCVRGLVLLLWQLAIIIDNFRRHSYRRR